MAKQMKESLKGKSAKTKKKTIVQVPKALIYIQSSFNNTIVTITDDKGNTLSWATSGSSGFTGTKKSTPFASSLAVKNALEKAQKYNILEAIIKVSGVGSGREQAVRAVGGHGIRITSIKDVTPIPHNGTRHKKIRRV